jgi:hypothetical protein
MRCRPIHLVIAGLLPLLALPALAGDGQSPVDAAVAEIRALYGEVGQGGGEECFGAPCLEAETTFARMLPGTGPQITRVRFQYAEHLDHEELIYGTPYLRKAVVRYNVAAQEYYAEYLFAGREPKLVFHFQSDPTTERRTWFADGEALRVDVRTKGDAASKVVRDDGFTAAEQGHFQSTIVRATELLALFGRLVGTADGEMGGWLYEE